MYPYLDTVDELHLRMFHYHNADSRSQSCYTDIQDTPQFLDTCLCCYYIDMADKFVPQYSQDIHTRQLSRHILGLVHYNHKLKTRKTEEITTSHGTVFVKIHPKILNLVVENFPIVNNYLFIFLLTLR